MNVPTSRSPRRARLLPLAGAIAALFAGPALAQTAPSLPVPAGAALPAGVSSISTTAGRMQVDTHQDRVVIPWSSFNVGAGNTVQFNQPSAASAVLNRVLTPGAPSAVDGTLLSNGKVYLINPAGISFGAGSTVLVGSLVASSLDMADDDFMNGIDRFKGAPGNGPIVMQGAIGVANGGTVALLGSSVVSTGYVRASGGDIVLAATSVDTRMELANKHLTIDMGNAPAGAVTIDGTLDTSTSAGDGGHVLLQASRVVLGTDLAVPTGTQDPAGQPGQVEVRNNTLAVAAQGGTISGADVANLLMLSDVKLTGTAAADAVVSDAISWPALPGASHALTLSSGGNLLVRNRIDATANGAAGRVALEFGQAQVAAGNTATDDFGLGPTGFAGRIDLPAGQNFSTRLGSDGDTKVYTVVTTPDQLQQALTPYTALGGDVDWSSTGNGFNPHNLVFNRLYFDQGVLKSQPVPGQYDGLGHGVFGLQLRADSYVGMFSVVSNSEVRNLALRNASLDCNLGCGVLAGTAVSGSSIRAVWIDGAQVTAHAVEDTFNAGVALPPSEIGGLVGVMNNGASVAGSLVSNTAMVLPAGSSTVGGLVGFMERSSTVSDSATSKVTLQGGADRAAPAPNLTRLGGFAGVVDTSSSILRSTASMPQILYGDSTNYNDPRPAGNPIPEALLEMPGTGGFVGVNAGRIDQSQAINPNLVVKRDGFNLGGFVGTNLGQISNSRASDVFVTFGVITADALLPTAIGGFAGAGQAWVSGLQPSISNSVVRRASLQGSSNVAGVGGFIGASSGGHAISDASAADALIIADGSGDSLRPGGSGGVGGFVGILESGQIVDSSTYRFSLTSGSANDIGGFAGRLGPLAGVDPSARVSRSYAEGTAYSIGGDRVGGFAAVVSGSVDNAYFNGTLNASGSTTVGGFAAVNRGWIDRTYTDSNPLGATAGFVSDNSGTITLSHYNRTRSGLGAAFDVNTGDAAGIDALTGVSMKQAANFPQWDFSPTGPWFIYEGRTDPLLGHLMTPATVTVVAPNVQTPYSGQAQTLTGTPQVIVTLADGTAGNPALVAGTRLVPVDSNPAVNAGDYNWLATGSYSTQRGYLFRSVDTQGGRLTITPVPLTVTANDDRKIYSGAVQASDQGASYSGFVNGEGAAQLSGVLSVTGSGKDAGSYTLTPGGLSATNYSIQYAQGKLTITPAPLTVTANNDSKTYNGTVQVGGKGATFDGFVGGDGVAQLDGTLSLTGGGKDVGSYAFTPGGLKSTNYSIRYNDGQITITPAPLTVTANSDTKIYNGTVQVGGDGATFEGFKGSDGVAQLDGALSFTGGGKDVGSYAFTPGGLKSTNYSIRYNDGQITITPAPLTVTANSDTKMYNGTVQSSDKGVSFSGFMAGEGAAQLEGSLVISGSGKDAGRYLLTPGGLSARNYSVQFANGALTITPAPLVVTANNDSKTYNGAVQVGGKGATFDGFMGSDGVAQLDGALSFTGGGKDVGSYAFTPGGLKSTNYAIRYNDGQITITPAPLTVTANDATKPYDKLPFSGGNGVGFSGFMPGDGPGQLRGTLVYGGDAQGALQPGTYLIVPGGLEAGNYAIQFVAGKLVITNLPPAPSLPTDAGTLDRVTSMAGLPEDPTIRDTPQARVTLPGPPHLCIEPRFLRLEGEERGLGREACRQPQPSQQPPAS